MTRTPTHTTEELLAQAGWVRALARRLVRDVHRADDLAQATLGYAVHRPPESCRPLRPWLGRVLANFARKERRTEARRSERERLAARPDREGAADELVSELEEQQRLANMVAALPDPYRSVILRRYYRGESASAIARDLGVPSATVRSQLARGLARLRVQLESRCAGDQRSVLGVLSIAMGKPRGSLGAWNLSTTITVMNTGQRLAALGTIAAVGIGTLVYLGARDGGGELGQGERAVVSTSAELAAEEVPPAVTPESDRLRTNVDATAANVEQATVGAEEPVAAGPTGHLVFARAIDESGQPIEGAQLVPVTEQGLPRDMPASAPSGPDGRVELSLARGAVFRYAEDEDANAFLALTGPVHATAFFVGRVTLNGRHDQGDIRLGPGGGVIGIVTDVDGVPVAGATVLGTDEPLSGDVESARRDGPDREGGRPTAVSDAAGRFELSGVRTGSAWIWARAPGTRWSVLEASPIAAGAVLHGVDLVLEPLSDAETIAGVVVGPSGVPVPGATITYWWGMDREERSVAADARGGFSVAATERGAYRLTARDPEQHFGPAAPRDVAPGDTDLVIELPPRRVLHVRAVDIAGNPIEGASALAVIADDRDDYMGQRWIRTDAEGRVELTARAAPFTVTVSLEGHRRCELGPFDPLALPGEELVAELAPLPQIYGRVVHRGDPVAGARIQLVREVGNNSVELFEGFPSRFWSSGGYDTVESDDEGRFSLPIERVGKKPVWILVQASGLAQAEHQIGLLVADEDVRDIEIELTPGGTLAGHVRVGPSRSREGIVVGVSRGDSINHFTRTDESGAYRFESLAPGPWRVEDRAEEPEGRTMSIAKLANAPFRFNCTVVEGELTRHDLDLRWQEDLRVRGSLLLDGTAAEGWTARVLAPRHADRPWDLAPVALDREGHFAAPAQPGRAVLELTSPAGELPARKLVRELTVDEHLGPQDVALYTGGLQGERPDANRRLRTFHRIDARTHFEAVFFTDGDGAFATAGLPAGSNSLQHEVDGPHGLGWYGLQTVDVARGETRSVE